VQLRGYQHIHCDPRDAQPQRCADPSAHRAADPSAHRPRAAEPGSHRRTHHRALFRANRRAHSRAQRRANERAHALPNVRQQADTLAHPGPGDGRAHGIAQHGPAQQSPDDEQPQWHAHYDRSKQPAHHRRAEPRTVKRLTHSRAISRRHASAHIRSNAARLCHRGGGPRRGLGGDDRRCRD
jgi:hypothetical protein